MRLPDFVNVYDDQADKEITDCTINKSVKDQSLIMALSLPHNSLSKLDSAS